ncbi:unnamed protein product [Amoebophrya sp. A25]|nr:unnamed protein product [Amoebophrya sp. A25]|eukprot:GSA25T00027382001.1
MSREDEDEGVAEKRAVWFARRIRMGNEFSSSSVVDAVLQFNDIRSAGYGPQQPTTSFISVDNSPETALKRGGEPLQLRLTRRSVISIRVVSANGTTAVGSCYIPVERVQEKGLGLVLYHMWFLLENVPVASVDDLATRFEQSLYSIGKSIYQPKICITLAETSEFRQFHQGGIYPLQDYAGTLLDESKAARYFSILHSHFQHLQLCQSYYATLQQREQNGQQAGAAPGPGGGGRSVIFGDPVHSGAAAGATQETAEQHRALAQFYKEQSESLEREAHRLRESLEDANREKFQLADTKNKLVGEMEILRESVGRSSEPPTGTSSEDVLRLQQETRNITKQANERIDKANETIRLLRSQAKGLQDRVKEITAERDAEKAESQRAKATLEEQLAAEKKKNSELMEIVRSLHSEFAATAEPEACDLPYERKHGTNAIMLPWSLENSTTRQLQAGTLVRISLKSR